MLDPTLALLLGAVAFGAFAQRATGIGFNLVAGPACALALEPSHVLGTLVRLAILADVAVILGDRARVDWRTVGSYLGPAAAALPLAVLASSTLPTRLLVAIAAIGTLGAAAVLLRSSVPPAPVLGPWPVVRRSGTTAAGFASGFLGVTTGLCGPPLALHASRSGRAMSTNRATMAVFFLVVDVAAAVAHRRAEDAALMGLLGAVLVVGVLLGGWAASRVAEARLRGALLVIVVASACAALARVVS